MSEVISLPKIGKRSKNREIIWTPTLEAIVNRVEIMLAAGPEIGLLIGSWGVGKTKVLDALATPNRRVIVMDPSTAGLRRGLLHIARTLGIFVEDWRWATYLVADEIKDRIEERMRNARTDGEQYLIMFDESQLMSLELIEAARWIHDATGCSMLFAGNPQWRRKLTEEKFGAFFSRVGMQVRINRPQAGDVAAFCAHHRVAGAREQAYLEQLATGPHALRAVVKTIAAARSIAGADKAVRLPHLKEGARDCGFAPTDEEE